MIRSFRARDVEKLFDDRGVPRLPELRASGEEKAVAAPSSGVASGLARAAGESAGGTERGPQGTAQHPDQESASFGVMETPSTLRSPITTEGATMVTRRLEPIHPGEILEEDFMRPLGLSANALAKRI